MATISNPTASRPYNMGYLIFISIVGALGGFLFGYDTAVISGTTEMVRSQFDLDAGGLGWYVGCALVGSIVGVIFAGVISDYFGRKKAMVISALLFSASAIGCAVSSSMAWLVFYRIVGGAGIGVASIVCPLYISELSVAAYRGRLVSLYQLAVTVGFLGAYIANYFVSVHAQDAMATVGSDPDFMQKIFVTESWRAMLGLEAFPAVLFFIVIFFIPESPRWLISRSRLDRAEGILAKVYNSMSAVKQEIKATLASCKSESSESSNNFRLLLRPGILKAVAIGAAIAMLGQFMGVNAVLYYGPQIFTDAGLDANDALLYQSAIGAVQILATVIALCIIDKVGRKALIYWGVSGMIVTLLLIAGYFSFGESMGVPTIVMLIFFMAYIFCCAVSISAVIFVILSEMYPTKVRGMAMSVAGLSLWVGTYLVGQLTPVLLEGLRPTGTFLLFAVMCVPYILIMWKLVPETTGKSLEEIERYWEPQSPDNQ